MKLAYILTTYPSKSETFASREIDQLGKLGCEISVFAATGWISDDARQRCAGVYYRPVLFKWRTILDALHLLRSYPLGLVNLIGLICRLLVSSPNDAGCILRNLHTVAFFARQLDKNAIHHVHAYFLNWPACIGMALAIVTKRSFSIACHARDIFVEHGALTLKASYADFITTCTKQGLDYLKTQLPKELHYKLHLNYHGISRKTAPLRSKDRQTAAVLPKNRLIAVGRLVPKKGFRHLLRAFRLVRDELPSCTLHIVGDGPERSKSEALIRRWNLTSHVHLLRWQDNHTVMRLMATATALVAPSVIAPDGDRDGIPNVILEAFSAELPVIASKLEGIGEAIIHNETGLLVEPGNITQLASAIVTLLRDKPLQQRLSKHAHERLLERFDLEKNAHTLARMFENVHEVN